MMHKKILHVILTSALIVGGAAPAFAQGYLDRMKEAAERRAENKAVRDAESEELGPCLPCVPCPLAFFGPCAGGAGRCLPAEDEAECAAAEAACACSWP